MSADRLREAAQVLRDRAEPDDSPLALALADWLDEVWGWNEEGLGSVPGLDGTNHPAAWNDMIYHAFEVADAILGGEDHERR